MKGKRGCSQEGIMRVQISIGSCLFECPIAQEEDEGRSGHFHEEGCDLAGKGSGGTGLFIRSRVNPPLPLEYKRQLLLGS